MMKLKMIFSFLLISCTLLSFAGLSHSVSAGNLAGNPAIKLKQATDNQQTGSVQARNDDSSNALPANGFSNSDSQNITQQNATLQNTTWPTLPSQNPPQQNTAQQYPPLPNLAAPSSTNGADYILGVGDQVRLTVYGEEDLSGTYEVGSTGVMALPLIGNVDAANKTIRQFEETVRQKLAGGYLHDPKVSAQVMNYRPFFILGEVAKPGSYPYVNGMTVLNAVALAGGYTYRANSDGAVIIRANDPTKSENKAKEDATVMPGDIIRVPERFF